MSDEPKDTQPAKLKLSRDLKAQDEPKPEPPPAMKLKRKEPAEDAPAVAKSPPPAESEKPEAQTDAKEDKPGFDPKNPFGDLIKQGEIKKPSSPPPELPSKPAPMIDDGSGAKVEAAIDSLNQEEEEAPPKSHLLPSIIVLLALLLVLASAGYGLWKVLQTPTDAETAETQEPAGTQTAAPAKGPIQKAKEAIAKVPVADVDAITGQNTPEASNASEASNTTEALVDQAPVDSAVPPVEETSPPAPPAASNSIEANKQSVSQYLSGIHIGGVRKGERPMILIGGESFQVGDVVHPETNLTFDGIRDGKLAFRDSHGIVYLKSF